MFCPEHYGRLSAARWTLISGAKISSFVGILGLFDQVYKYIDSLIHISDQVPSRKAHGAMRNTRKGSGRHAGNVRMGSCSAVTVTEWNRNHTFLTLTRDR